MARDAKLQEWLDSWQPRVCAWCEYGGGSFPRKTRAGEYIGICQDCDDYITRREQGAQVGTLPESSSHPAETEA